MTNKKGFSSPEKQKEANKKYQKSDKGALAIKKANAKYYAKKFFTEYATIEDIKEFKKIIFEKEKHMEKLIDYSWSVGEIVGFYALKANTPKEETDIKNLVRKITKEGLGNADKLSIINDLVAKLSLNFSKVDISDISTLISDVLLYGEEHKDEEIDRFEFVKGYFKKLADG